SFRAITNPVGPVRWGRSGASVEPSMATRARRFFTIRYSADAAFSCFRSSESCWTVSPRYSVRTAAVAPPSRRRNVSIVSAFAAVGTVGLLQLELAGDALHVDGHARSHRGRDRHAPQVRPLGRRRLGLYQGLDNRGRVGRQMLGRERSLADRHVNV